MTIGLSQQPTVFKIIPLSPLLVNEKLQKKGRSMFTMQHGSHCPGESICKMLQI